MAVKRVFSAGGIVLRPLVSDPVSSNSETGSETEDGRWEILVTQHSKHKGWDFPKGHLEVGETSEAAALREVKEETGIKAEIIEKVGATQYFYWEDGEPYSAPQSGATKGKQKVFKTVTFFLMRFIEQGEATTAFEVSAHKWLSVDDVEAQLTFKDTKELWSKARENIEQLAINN